MRKSKFTNDEKLAILAEQEYGLPIADICSKYGISLSLFHKWKKMLIPPNIDSDNNTLKHLENENARLRKIIRTQNTYIEELNLKLMVMNKKDS
jgi:putative transposase